MKQIILSFLLVILTVSCSSLSKKAEELLKNESYTEAIEVYQEILRSDSQDEEALAGLRKAQLGWISQKLIEVRLLRLAGNRLKSLDLLREIYVNESQWSLFPKGAATFTQKEESGFAQESVEYLVQEAVADEHPLRAQFYLDRYGTFFQSKKAEKQFNQMQSHVKQSGTKQCLIFSASLSPEQFYYGRFVRQFCQVWNLRQPSLKKQVRTLRGELYSTIDLVDKTKGMTENFSLKLRNALVQKLKSSPWYDEKSGKNIKLTLAGQYDYNHAKHLETLKHSYSVSIPYQVERIEQKSDPKKQSGFDAALDLAVATTNMMSVLSGQKISSSYSRDNGDGTITVTETKYRQEPRATTYSAVSHQETFQLALALSGPLGSGHLDTAHNASDRNTSIEHHNNMPDIGLTPQRARLVGQVDWLEAKVDVFAENFESQLNEAWDQLYCKDSLGEMSSAKTLEAMFRCLRIRHTEVPVTISQWFKANIGLSFNEAEKVVSGVL